MKRRLKTKKKPIQQVKVEIVEEKKRIQRELEENMEMQFLDSLTPEERNRYILEKEFGIKVS